MAIARRLVGTNVSRANKTTNLLNADNHANFKRPSRPWPRSAGTINGINRPIQYPKQAISKSEVEYQLTGRGVASWRFVFISNNTTSCPGAVWRHIEGNVQIYTALRASSINFCSSNRHRHPYKYFYQKLQKETFRVDYKCLTSECMYASFIVQWTTSSAVFFSDELLLYDNGTLRPTEDHHHHRP